MVSHREQDESTEENGLVWGSSTLALTGYAIKNLLKKGGVEDDNIRNNVLEKQITSFGDISLVSGQDCCQQDQHPFLLTD